MDAAEDLLYEVGYAGVTTRAVAEKAGVNRGLVHYYFGSMEELLTQTLERFVDQLAEALEALYEDPNLSFAEKWRLGSQFWVQEPTSRFPKILLELLAVGWNMPALKIRLTEVHARFRTIFERNFGQALRDYGLDERQFPLRVIVAAVTSYQLGLIVEGLSGVDVGHSDLVDWIQGWIDSLETQAFGAKVEPPGISQAHGSRDSELVEQAAEARPRRRRGVDDELHRVAAAYKSAGTRGVKEALHVSESQAYRWVRKARDVGLLPENDRFLNSEHLD